MFKKLVLSNIVESMFYTGVGKIRFTVVCMEKKTIFNKYVI